MEGLTLKELMEAKGEIEKEISAAVTEFQNKYKVKVSNIDLHNSYTVGQKHAFMCESRIEVYIP